MKKYDTATIEYFGVPSLVLMERAALSAAEEIEKRFKKGSKVLVVAGVGNNGGDGIAIGRILMQHGYQINIVLIGNREKCSEETARQLAIIEKYGCLVQDKMEDREYDIIVDALFGIGLAREVKGIYEEGIRMINEKQSFVCAIDIPSGIHADTGEIMNAAVKADITVTFGFEKLGHVLYPGCEYAGEVIVRDIGITEESFLTKEPLVYTYNGNAKEFLPERNGGGNKGTFGKILVIAGSVNMSGACELCARSAYRTGAGMVKIVSPAENREIIQRKIPEALLSVYSKDEEEADRKEALQKDIEWADCILIGPGIGMGETAAAMLEQVLTQTDKPLVIDADGLNLLAKSDGLKQYLDDRTLKSRELILTPHIAEFARLYGCSVKEAKKDILTKPKELADRWKCVVVCKDARTICVNPFSYHIYLNKTGNNGMATAGSGDVLTGIIGGLLAQGMKAQEAASLSVYLHGKAGDAAAARMGQYALMAGDLTEQLKEILQ